MMITLHDVKQAIDHLSPEERTELRTYLDQIERETLLLRVGTMDIDVFLEVAAAIRATMSEEAFDEMLAAMNEDYIEPIDEDGFPL